MVGRSNGGGYAARMNAENQGEQNGGGEPGDSDTPLPRDLTAEPPAEAPAN